MPPGRERVVSVSESGPFFTGLGIHRDLVHHYSFLYPDGWFRHEPADAIGSEVIYAPSATNVDNSFSVQSSILSVKVSGRDLQALREGLEAGLRQLPGCQVEDLTTYRAHDVIGLEARHTYEDGEQKRKRWVRLLYRGELQVRIVAQGATAAEFEYWMPMFSQSMRTFKFGDWWSAVTGKEWLPSLARAENE